jgi:hypothetical protein
MTSKHSRAPVLISQGIFDSVKTFRDFEQRVSALFDTNTKAQGDAFEIFVEAYLATQPILQCQETWLVGDIPVEIREALNLRVLAVNHRIRLLLIRGSLVKT